MDEPLSVIDAWSLRLESETAPMHLGWRATLVPGRRLPRPTVDALRAVVAGRLDRVPRSRRRVATRTLGARSPCWTEDQAFDLAAHVVALRDERVALTPEQFVVAADDFLATPLDRTRPLWRIGFVPSLTDGRAGLVLKVHRAMADGVAGARVARLLLDDDSLASDPGAGPAAEIPRAPPAPADLRRPRSQDAASLVRGVAQLVSDGMAHPVRPCFLNRSSGGPRSLLGLRLPEPVIDRAADRHDATPDEILLAGIAGALRRLAAGGDRSRGVVRALLPVDHRGAPAGADVAFDAVELPVGEATPSARIAAIRAQGIRSDGGRAGAARAAGAHAVAGMAAAIPRPWRTSLVRALGARAANLTVVPVRGPGGPLYVLGAELDELYPAVPMPDGHALAIGIFTHRGTADVGITVDAAALPGAGVLPSLLADEIRALAGVARRRRGRPGRPRSRASLRVLPT